VWLISGFFTFILSHLSNQFISFTNPIILIFYRYLTVRFFIAVRRKNPDTSPSNTIYYPILREANMEYTIPQTLPPKELAQQLNLNTRVNTAGLCEIYPDLFTPRRLEAWRREGYGPPYIRVGRSKFIAYDVVEVEAWIASRQGVPCHYSDGNKAAA
jgi:hypothetical protein